MDIEEIKIIVSTIAKEYPIKRIVLFGSRADDTNHSDSDVDLIVECSEPVSLLTLSKIKIEMEDALNLDVDIIHGPITETDMIEVKNEVVLYSA